MPKTLLAALAAFALVGCAAEQADEPKRTLASLDATTSAPTAPPAVTPTTKPATKPAATRPAAPTTKPPAPPPVTRRPSAPPPRPVVTTKRPAPVVRALTCTASMTNTAPTKRSTTTVVVRTASGASATATAHYKTTETSHTRVADSAGTARIPFNIGGATAGYRVVVDVVVSKAGQSGSCSTSFVPR